MVTATATDAAAISERRLRSVMDRSIAQHVPDTAHRMQQPWLAPGLGLAPQVAHIDAQRVGGGPEVVAPYVLEDRGAREHLAGVAHEELEQQELGAGELD